MRRHGLLNVDEVDLATPLRDLGGARELLVVLLVAAAGGVAAVRRQAAILALAALALRGVEGHPRLRGRASCAHPRAQAVALVAALLLGPAILYAQAGGG